MSIKPTILILALVTVSCVFSTPLQADYDASDLQKLFTDKKQRAQIDATRSGKSSGAGAQLTSKINVSGYVTRSDGKSVVWVNNENTLDNQRVGGVKIQKSSIGKNKRVTVSVDGKRKQLKPGEVWHKETGEVVENY